jgi:hypothetical protein
VAADAGAAIQQVRHERRRVNAGATLPARAENHRNVQRADFIHGCLLSANVTIERKGREGRKEY